MNKPSDKNITHRTVLISGIVALLGLAVASCAIVQNSTRTQEQSMDLISTDRQTLAAAQRAFDAWKQSLETGDEQVFAAVVADNVKFVVNLPFDQWRGEHQGRARVEELLRFERDVLKLRPRITQLNVLANGNRVAFEWSVEGTVLGKPRRPDTRNLLIFEVDDDKVVNFREYFGYVD